jgi:hypothetical protein
MSPFRRKHSSPICADAIFADYRGPSASTCLSYAVMQISDEGFSEFSRRNRFYKRRQKQQNKKPRGGFAFFGYFFVEAKK